MNFAGQSPLHLGTANVGLSVHIAVKSQIKSARTAELKPNQKSKAMWNNLVWIPMLKIITKEGPPPTGAEGGWAARYTWRVPHFRTPELLCLHSKYGKKNRKLSA